MNNQSGGLARFFKFNEHGTTLGTEINAGITTFMTMAYILAVNPQILADAGMDAGAVFTATALSSFIAILIMALYANLPFALAPGMGLNAFFAYTVVLKMGYPWQFALAAVLVEGIIFIILSFFNVREAIIDSIPMDIKRAISVGIGLFIAFIGLINAGIIVQGDGVLIGLGDLGTNTAIVALLGILITAVLLSYKVKGAILIGILASTLIGFPLGVTVWNGIFSMPPSLTPTFMQFDFSQFFSIEFLVVVFTFLMIDMFDTVGTLVGVSTKAGMLDEEGRVPKAKQALLADAIGTTVGAILGTSTVTTYVESASGVNEGGRTGMTALTTGILFLLALFFAPLFLMIPGAATAPALIVVGAMMMSPVLEIDFNDMSNAIPSFLTIIMMPLAYSISEGIAFGMISFVLIKLLSGRAKEIPALSYVVAIIFILAKVLL
ncbi:MAG TPA: NCS2 family permease [Tissierellia bacterium]|nr:NCS2 family permease [Tissierellia bacterium]